MAEDAIEESWASGDLESKLQGPSHTGSKDVSTWTAFTLTFRLMFFPEAHQEGPKGETGTIRVLHSLIASPFLLVLSGWGKREKRKNERGGEGKACAGVTNGASIESRLL